MLLSLFLVTLLSYVALIEAVVGGLLGDAAIIRFSKTRLLLALVVIQALLAVFFTFRPELIGIADLLFGSAGMMIGGCLALLALAWGIGRAETVKQVFGTKYKLLSSVYFFWIKWAAPAILIIVLSGTLYEAITG